jgi:two-component system copper resistance phosphate regulon response regulator CusR
MELFVIEDEKKTAAFPGQGVARSRLAVELAHDGETGLRRARAPEFDLLIVDVMLSKKDGWEVVAELRRDGMRTAIRFLTARDNVRDRVKGLELEADDYLVKPFAFLELLALLLVRLDHVPTAS